MGREQLLDGSVRRQMTYYFQHRLYGGETARRRYHDGVVTGLAMTGVTVSGNHTGAISVRAVGNAEFSELYISGKQTASNTVQGMILHTPTWRRLKLPDASS